MIPDLPRKLAPPRISIHLCMLGLIVGVLSSFLLILFQFAITFLQDIVASGDFTQLPIGLRILLPLFGAGVILVMISRTKTQYRRMGIAYVIHRVKLYNGRIPFTSGLSQFFHAVLALACGFSVGREGPAVHIGATAATILSKRWELPDNAMRILSSCGIAAGIAAFFNTPLAGVIFVLEVVLQEYTIYYFLPILIASLTGAISYRLVFDDVHSYSYLQLHELPLEQYPPLFVFGLLLGIAAALFSHTLIKATAFANTLQLKHRFLVAGGVTAILAAQFPLSMGGETVAVQLAHSADVTTGVLLGMLLAKSLATISAIGFGIPGGLIGPLYAVGALLGGWVALFFANLQPDIAEHQSMYAAIGMTAMMGVCLNAPMASLLALVELTNNATVILPGLMVTLPAFLLAHEGLKARPIFLRQLDIMGLGYKVPPLHQALEKTGVMALMNQDINWALRCQSRDDWYQELVDQPNKPLVLDNNEQVFLITPETDLSTPDTAVKLQDLEGVPDSATLLEAFKLLDPTDDGAIYVFSQRTQDPIGIITKTMLADHIRHDAV